MRRFKMVAVVPLRKRVADRLREAIADGSFQPGERLIERTLCEMAEVSRTSVREALRQLESEGLVETLRNRGPIVARIGRKDASDIFEARAVLEGLAARLFVRRALPAHLRALEALFQQLDCAYRAGNVARFLAVKMRFYDALLMGADNKVVTDGLRSIYVRVNQLRATSLSMPGRIDKSMEEVRLIVEALRVRDEEAAWQRSVEHVRHAAEAALQAMAER